MSPPETGSAAPSATKADSPSNTAQRDRRIRTPPPVDPPALAQPQSKRVDGRGRHPNSRANLKRGGNPENLIHYRRNALDALLTMVNHESRDSDNVVSGHWM